VDEQTAQGFDRIEKLVTEQCGRLLSEIAGVNATAKKALETGQEALELAERLRSRVDGSDPPQHGPNGTNGTTPPIAKRITDAEGSLTEVLGELAQVKATLAQQNRVAGIADEGTRLAKRAVMFLTSREGVKFVLHLATVGGLAWYTFRHELATHDPPQLAPVSISPRTQ
jgi:hypothetical protein